MATRRSEDKLRTILPKYLKGSTQKQYLTKLSSIEKDLLRAAPLSNQYEVLITRFKESNSAALDALEKEKYTIADARARRHRPYGNMEIIHSPPVPFHTIAIDFVLALPHAKARQEFDYILSVTDKFSKMVTIIPGKSTFGAKDQAQLLLRSLLIGNQGTPKAIILDRDRKFLSEFWQTLFKELGVNLLYSSVYHPQTDGMSERTNQTVEVALRFYISTLQDPTTQPTVLLKI